MSASLVGSEMCIRDRQGGKETQIHRGNGTHRHRDTAEAKRHARGKHEHCLLYTSDAADDM
eukprot:2744187-Alexandrium_andersonii.AAC.1